MSVLLPRLTSIVLATILQDSGAGGAPPERAPAGAQERAAPRVESLYEGALVGAEDGQDFAETHGYRRLLEIVARYTDEELRRKAVALDFGYALATPDLWRGQIVRVRGIAAGIETVRLAQPIGERVDVFRAIVTEADGSEGVVVDFLQPPPAGIEIGRDVVDLEAVFFRTVRYENRRGMRTNAPYLIARGLQRLDQEALPRDTSIDRVTLLLIGAAVTYFVIRLLLSLRSRKSRSDKDRARVSTLIRQRAARAAAPTPAAPSQDEHESC